MTSFVRGLLPLTALAALTTAMPATAQDDLIARSRAAYAALRSYADSGAVMVETGVPGAPPAVERHTFSTRFRSPRHFYFEFRKGSSSSSSAGAGSGGERLAIWCDGGDFQSWWSATGVHEIYSGGRGVSAFTSAVYPTAGAATHIPPFLFPAAEMHGPLVDIKDVRVVATEDVNGRRTQKVSGVVQSHFGAARPTTIWIDAGTLLVVKLVEDTPIGSPAGHLERITTTFEPQVNPVLDDSRFQFAVPPGG